MNDWSRDVCDILVSAEIRQVAYVPDMGLKRLIELCKYEERLNTVSLTTEEEGIGILSGAWLGGERGVLLMQSSGVGNCINMLSLTRMCEIPLLMIVTMRGLHNEFNSWQNPMGQSAKAVLEAAGVSALMVESSEDIARTVAESVRSVFDENARIAVMVHQKVMPTKTFGK